MRAMETRAHWEDVYRDKASDEVSWFQGRPELSLGMIERSATSQDAAIIDVGAGDSRLAGCLLDAGFEHVWVLDIAESALDRARRQLGDRAPKVHWVQADITRARLGRRFEVWHDRAVFHFLTDAGDRARYRRTMLDALEPGGHAVIATFALDGPERCSGLPIVRYSPRTLHAELGPALEPVETAVEVHETPWGTSQSFQFTRLRRAA